MKRSSPTGRTPASLSNSLDKQLTMYSLGASTGGSFDKNWRGSGTGSLRSDWECWLARCPPRPRSCTRPRT